MAAIKHTLQREVFLPSGERLIAVVHVTKAGKKKKVSFLCAAVSTEKPIQAQICQVKKSDRGDSYKKKASWTLRELRSLDSKCTGNKDSAEFDIQLDKTYKWIASSLTEKNTFLQCLHKLSQRYLVQKPKFLNIPSGLLDDGSHSSEVERSVQQAEELASAAEWEYQALTTKEEADLETLMSQVDNAIGNAEAFSEQLSRDLSVLDGANVHSIMGSEDQVLELMMLLDKGLQEAIHMEGKLDEYDDKLQSVKDLMEVVKDKDTMIQIRNTNHQKLLEELDSMVSNLDLEQNYIRALLDADLSTPKGIKECTLASKALLKCMAAEIHPSLKQMAAVQEQQKRFTKLKTTFSKRVAHHLNNLFIHQGNELGESASRHQGELKLVSHKSSHKDLLPYADMMFWMKQCDNASFNKLAKIYTQSISKLYDREVKEFIENAKQKLGHGKMDKKDTSNWFVATAVEKKPHSGSSGSLNKHLDNKGRSSSITTLDSDHTSLHGSEADITGRGKFDQMLEVILNELAPICNAEQDFCVKFFHLATTVEDDTGEQATDDTPTGFKQPLFDSIALYRKQCRDPKEQKRIHEELRTMMSELFPSLETELREFINTGHKMDSFNSLYMLVRMSQSLMSSADTNSFLIKLLGTCLVNIRRNFDNFIKRQIHIIQECKPFKKSKIGIISFVHQFQEFAQQSEHIFKGSERRNELDKAYVELTTVIFKEIARVASESPKIPMDVIMFENYHHMYSVLAQLKISVLEKQKKEAKQLYQDHLQRYTTVQLGRPMEKLNVFFEGIQGRVAAGVKEEEVGYQLAYSKQELRKVIKEYPGKEVKKGLDHLYKRVDKNLSEEGNLLQVVWHTMQDEFLKQYKHFDGLIAKCYPGSGITLEFTIDDVLLYFSDIAQSH